MTTEHRAKLAEQIADLECNLAGLRHEMLDRKDPEPSVEKIQEWIHGDRPMATKGAKDL